MVSCGSRSPIAWCISGNHQHALRFTVCLVSGQLGFLEGFHNANWVTSLYAVSVLGAAAAALALYGLGLTLAPSLLVNAGPLYGCFGGTFGLLAAIGLLYGDTQFMMFPLPIGIKARYLVIIYALVAIAMLFSQQRIFAFAQLGGALGRPALRSTLAPRHCGRRFMFSESWYGACAIAYYRWKRRRAAHASLRSTCDRKAGRSSSTGRAGRATRTPTTRSGGTEEGRDQGMRQE